MNPMRNKLKITYLFESTTLWGGNKVGLEQAEALSEAGHNVTILSKDAGPTWYDLRLPVTQVSDFDYVTIPESDIIVGTYWPTVKAAYESGKGIPVHLCQGYEGDYKELLHLKSVIDEVYSYKIPKLTVSPHLDKFLIERFQAETYFIGQMLNKDIFYPARNMNENKPESLSVWKKVINTFNALFNKKQQHSAPFKVLVVGPFEVIFKNIPTALRGISIAKEKMKTPIKLTRVSQFPLSAEEEAIIKPDAYHFHLSHQSMGEIYRNADLFISTSEEAEGFGLPALEAMGCGIPTILSNISSYTSFDDLLDYALFIDPSDTEALAEAISKLFHEHALRDRLARRGLSVAENFTKEKVVNKLENAFEKILHRPTLKGRQSNKGIELR